MDTLALLPALAERFDWQYANEYGEPGYGDTRTNAVVLGNYWCRCGKVDGLHGLETHYPRLFAALESDGIEFEWSDEWTIDYENSKAYRTQADSYSWQPTAIITEHGDLLTPDDDIETWIEWADREPSRCIPRSVFSRQDLADAGFVQWEHDGQTFENGWHPGQTDDPREILAALTIEYPDDTVVFYLAATGQFDVRFECYRRDAEWPNADY